jgi:hypothetical protein
VQSTEESIVVSKVPKVGPAEAKDDTTEEPKVEKTVKMPEILSPSVEAKLPKVQKGLAATPKRRMASVLDAVMETTKALSPAPTKKIAEAEAGPSAPIETKVVVPKDKVDQQTSGTGMAAGQDMAKKQSLLPPKLQPKMLITLFDMLWRKIIRRRNPRSQILCPKTKISKRGLSV